jgi:hypothetical protein
MPALDPAIRGGTTENVALNRAEGATDALEYAALFHLDGTRHHWLCALTQTATSGLSAGAGAMPHDTEFSVRKVAALLLMPQKAVTSTSSGSHRMVQDCKAQFARTIRVCEAGPGGPGGP